MKLIFNLEVFYEGSEINKGEKDDLNDRYWKYVFLLIKVKINLDGEIGISILSYLIKVDIVIF